ncbi:helix-turn-helix domain-containing protein [Lysinibacillus xylanilyticus]|uniref:helix-turn-helix domain-containing protein n=1 Tax=Lysinibacillus xylanilyticus TaxID=582475 RepID=UPI00380FA3A6
MQNLYKTLREVRLNQNFSQKYVIGNKISQSNYSKFEQKQIEINMSSFLYIVEKLEVSIEEIEFIHNNYQYSMRGKILKLFYEEPFNNKEKLLELIKQCTIFLEIKEDIFIKDILFICQSLLVLLETDDYSLTSISANKVWDRLSKKDHLYINDIYLLNCILFIFPLETAKELKKFLEKSIERYHGFKNVNVVNVNLRLNFALLLIRDRDYKEAYKELIHTEELCKKFHYSVQLAICFIRKGICLNSLNGEGEEWIEKGKTILSLLEENVALKLIKEEIKKYSN